MLKPLLRLLALLLALVVPVQGLAAVAAGQCMTLGHHQDADQGADHHTHGGQDGHDHADNDHAAGGHGNEGKQSHCGPCTSCCASASIAGPQRVCIVSTATSAKYVFSQSAPPGVQLDGLDRPPLAL